uniref:Sec-independent protein translocase component TatC n=1 Tax=Betaphycus gelatinus TaxID=1191690 RepID=A0A2H4QI46_9FLOR|nr:Sec-independent protein translocase component TatC [Betaphycus gelatinus]ATX68824.1 Sec-independent protein translocase component TatC [Betaphycus gelatinus]
MFRIHAKEFFYRFFYIVSGFFGCLTLSLLKVDIILLMIVNPFQKFSAEKLLATKVTDLIDTVIALSFYNSLLFIYPLFIYHLISFLKASFYDYQICIFFKILILSTLMYLISLSFLHLLFLPGFFNFLLSWKTDSFQNLLSVETELRIINYINWILLTEYLMSSLIHWLFIIIFKTSMAVELNDIYKGVKRWKKQMLFFLIFLLFLLFPPDFYLQFSLLFVSILFVEIIFILLCYIVKNSKNADYTAIIKKI